MPSPLPTESWAARHAVAGARHARSGRDGGNRRFDIQGLRAVAVLMVVAYHAGLPIPGGFVGVDVFFVVSGFVITAMLQREWAATGTIRFFPFYVRRFKRLTPALALVVTATLVASALVLSPLGPQQTAGQTAIGAMLLSANYVIATTTGGYFDAPAAVNPLLHTWSLSVEEQFYLAFPALLALGWVIARRRFGRTGPVLLVGLVAVASFGLAVVGSTGGSLGESEAIGFYSSLTRAWEFSVGALLALGLPRIAVGSRALGQGLALAGATLLGASLFLITEATPFPGVWTLMPVLGTALLLLAGTDGGNAVSTALGRAAMVKVGDWSYSIYLWHWPFIVFAIILWPETAWAPLAAALASFGPAIASFHWVEQPIRSIRRLSGPRLAVLVALTLTPPLALATFLALSPEPAQDEAVVEDGEATEGPIDQAALYAAASAFHAGNEVGCHTPEPISERSASDCTWNEFSTGVPIYLVGDSNADHFSEAAIGAAYEIDRPVTIATIDTCPFFAVSLERLSGPDPFFEPCADHFAATLAWLIEQEPGLVIVSNSDEVFLDPDVAIGLTPESMTSDPAEKAQVRVEGVTATVSALRDAGHSVLLVQTVPHFVPPFSYQPDLCSVASMNAGTCGESVERDVAEGIQGAPREALAVAADRTGSTVLDVWDFLCPDGVCSTRTEDMVRYRDSFHISVPASEALTPEFVRAIQAAG